MHYLPLAFALAFLLGCAGDHRPPSKNEVIAHTLATTVQLVTERPGGARRSGSAVVLGDGSDGRAFVITAHHVLAPEPEQRLAVQFADGWPLLTALFILGQATVTSIQLTLNPESSSGASEQGRACKR